MQPFYEPQFDAVDKVTQSQIGDRLIKMGDG